MFDFFGLFAHPKAILRQQLLERWPDIGVVEINTPFAGVAARFSERVYEPAKEDLPEPVSDEIKRLSMSYPSIRFLLLRTFCWGGDCFNWGHIIQQGQIVYQTDGDEALRRLVGQFGVDIGPSEIFEPLARNFPWEASAL